MSFFSREYSEAREKFLGAAEAAGCRSLRYRVPAEESPELFIDLALLRRDPGKVLLHVCGVHGIEGYVGSAIQSARLKEGFRGDGPSVLFVHALNPYGMAFYRRGNKENVDLNRNYLRARDPGLNPEYELFRSYLGPQSELEFWTGLAKAYFAYKRIGKGRSAQAIASGQTRHPDGLFYCGERVAREILLLQDFLRSHFAAEAREVLAIDVHSGLGDYGGELLFVDEDTDPEAPPFFANAFGRPTSTPDPDEGTYKNNGRFSDALRDALPGAKVRYVLQEFGTYPDTKVLNATRRENFAWHMHKVGSRAHDRAAEGIYEAFVPEDHGWREKVLGLGLERLRQAETALR